MKCPDIASQGCVEQHHEYAEPTDNPDAPIAYAVLGSSGAALAIPVRRRTAREDFRIIDVMTLDRVDFPIQMSRIWGDSARLN